MEPTGPDSLPVSLPSPSPAELTQSMQLAVRAQGGDRQALDDLFRRYEAQVHRIARIRMGRRVRAFMDSGDLVQNTYLVATRKIGSLELASHASIIQWLAKILENQVREAARYLRAEKRDRDEVSFERGEPDGGSLGSRVHPPAATPAPPEAVSDAELRELYDRGVESLEGDYREVILLRDYAGMTWQDVADELGRPTKRATEQLYQRARLKLARILSRVLDLGERG